MIDPKEAPEGYEAVRGPCSECCFHTVDCSDIYPACVAGNRKDGHMVIFRKVEE